MKTNIKVSLGFISMICFLGWLDLKFCLYFLLSLLCHECGHLFAMWFLHISVVDVSLTTGGAVISGRFSDYRRELLCAAAGPVSSFFFGIILLRHTSYLAVINIILGIVNLLPIYPLDGGRILHAVLCSVLEVERAMHVLRVVTAVACCFIMIGACWVTAALQAGIWPVFAALVLLIRVGNAGAAVK